LTLKNANPAKTLSQARVRGLALLTKVVLVEDGSKSFLAYETLNGGRGIMEAKSARRLS